MRINRNTVLVGHKVVLVPYRKQHVPQYHEWMKDPLIQEQTASEPLSLDEEYEMQQSWAVDEDKLTFIILARHEIDALKTTMASLQVQDLVSKCKMVGDVNIFFNAKHDDEEEGEVNSTTRDKQKEPIFDAECEIMIAEHSYRRKGIAREALRMMFAFVTAVPTPIAEASPGGNRDSNASRNTMDPPSSADASHCTLPIPSNWLTCKISLSNEPSIKLFESLGFTWQSVSEIWKEVEMRFTATDADHIDRFSRSIQQVVLWPDE